MRTILSIQLREKGVLAFTLPTHLRLKIAIETSLYLMIILMIRSVQLYGPIFPGGPLAFFSGNSVQWVRTHFIVSCVLSYWYELDRISVKPYEFKNEVSQASFSTCKTNFNLQPLIILAIKSTEQMLWMTHLYMPHNPDKWACPIQVHYNISSVIWLSNE